MNIKNPQMKDCNKNVVRHLTHTVDKHVAYSAPGIREDFMYLLVLMDRISKD